MKKQGFTLAEILITLGIIGIVAAITLPGLNNSVSSRKVGPALAKAINNLENANRTALVKQNRRTIEDLDVTYSKDDLNLSSDDVKSYLNRIARYLQGELMLDGSDIREAKFLSKDGISYEMYSKEGSNLLTSGKQADLPRSKYHGKYFTVLIDVNGKSQPNKPGEDQFLVYVDNFGIVIPAGGLEAAEYLGKDDERKDCTKDKISAKCTGTIADAGWEVRY